MTILKPFFSAGLSLSCGAEKHLVGLAEWTMPSAGMFMWIKLLAGVSDSDDILDELRKSKVVVVPGQLPGSFLADVMYRTMHC